MVLGNTSARPVLASVLNTASWNLPAFCRRFPASHKGSGGRYYIEAANQTNLKPTPNHVFAHIPTVGGVFFFSLTSAFIFQKGRSPTCRLVTTPSQWHRIQQLIAWNQIVFMLKTDPTGTLAWSWNLETAPLTICGSPSFVACGSPSAGVMASPVSVYSPNALDTHISSVCASILQWQII